ncbi:hypothetical protein AB0D54_16380 [Streptomyces xanthophaeus]|uniref:hypothetical protein n=1 Tax=Streptomyces xanthophaeus TaxID=67385 RepID=UPI003432F641
MSGDGAGRTVRLPLPGFPETTAAVSTGTVLTALLTGAVPPDSRLVWPLVVLALGFLAYDIGIRAVRRRAEKPEENPTD